MLVNPWHSIPEGYEPEIGWAAEEEWLDVRCIEPLWQMLSDCRDAGKSLDETAAELADMREQMCQVFTVDDLHFLRKGGRISGAVAFVGTLLDFKPLLKGNEEGKIVMCGKTRGKKRAIAAMAEKYESLVVNAQEQRIGIAYAGHHEDALALEALLKKNKPSREILTVCYEPVTGIHVGPGMLSLFFIGSGR